MISTYPLALKIIVTFIQYIYSFILYKIGNMCCCSGTHQKQLKCLYFYLFHHIAIQQRKVSVYGNYKLDNSGHLMFQFYPPTYGM